MGMDLFGEKRIFSVNWHGWRRFYELAIENGWEPEGTKPPGTVQMINPYGDGKSAETIVEILKTVSLDNLIQKQFVD